MSFNCEETYRRMQDYLDRELSLVEMSLVAEHLSGCGMCAEEFEFESKVLRKIGRTLVDTEVPHDLVERVLNSIANT